MTDKKTDFDPATSDPFKILLGEYTPEEMAAIEAWQKKNREEYENSREAKWAKIDAENRRLRRERPCPRCSGRGVMDEYAHIMNGKCFSCGGSGIDK